MLHLFFHAFCPHFVLLTLKPFADTRCPLFSKCYWFIGKVNAASGYEIRDGHSMSEIFTAQPSFPDIGTWMHYGGGGWGENELHPYPEFIYLEVSSIDSKKHAIMYVCLRIRLLVLSGYLL